MTFRLHQAQYDDQTERAYVEFRRGDGDGGEQVVVAVSELKLLAPPSSAPVEPTPPQAKRALTEEQMRKMLADRERPFSRPIKYPKGMAMP